MPIFCFHCEKLFSNQSNLNRHTKEVHPDKNQELTIQYSPEVYLFKCLEGCQVSFRFNKYLRSHLYVKHNLEFNSEELIFRGKDEFEEWLSKLEVENNIKYSSASGVKCNDDKSTIYLNCSRSGKQRTLTERKRSEKVQGSSKQNIACTSQIIVTITSSGEYVTEYFKNHYGHNFDLKHLTLSENCRKNIASKMIIGVPPKHILTSIRQNIGGTLKRDDLLTMKDMGNIKTSFNICLKDGQRHKNDDRSSVELYIEECRQLNEHNPILFYKKQGEHLIGFEDNDMCLVIMYPIQKELFKQFSGNIVCVDGTHGLNSYDFEMTTILVIDEFRQGFPTAFLFSNRKDQFIYEVFFENVKKAVEIEKVNINTLMTDVTTVYCNAWLSVMGSITDHLYCAWHIDRAWQQNLHKVKDIEKRSWVYKTLKYLQTLLCEQDFESEFIKFLNILCSHNSTQEMYIYLKNNYYKNRQKWAYCYRKKKGINTNMFIENMHKVIKYEYLNGKKVKRLDKTLNFLQKFITDKGVDRLVKLTKGKHLKQVVDIKKSHRTALCSNFKVNVEDNCYIFHTENNQIAYLVSPTNKDICCELKCPYCNICWHTFECTCLDYQIKSMICKHIHFVVLQYIDNSVPALNTSLHERQSQEIQMLTEIINKDSTSHSLADPHSAGLADAERKKQKIKNSALNLIANIDSLHYKMEELDFILQNLNVLNSMGSKSELTEAGKFTGRNQIATAEPANKNVTKQKSYFSTKKKRKLVENFAKPCLEEADTIKETLTNSLFTSKNSDYDHSYI